METGRGDDHDGGGQQEPPLSEASLPEDPTSSLLTRAEQVYDGQQYEGSAAAAASPLLTEEAAGNGGDGLYGQYGSAYDGSEGAYEGIWQPSHVEGEVQPAGQGQEEGSSYCPTGEWANYQQQEGVLAGEGQVENNNDMQQPGEYYDPSYYQEYYYQPEQQQVADTTYDYDGYEHDDRDPQQQWIDPSQVADINTAPQQQEEEEGGGGGGEWVSSSTCEDPQDETQATVVPTALDHLPVAPRHVVPHPSHNTRRLERLLRFIKQKATYHRLPTYKPPPPPMKLRHPGHEPLRIIRVRRMLVILTQRKALAMERAKAKASTESNKDQKEKDMGAKGGQTRISKPWPLVVQYTNEVLSQCLVPGVQSTMHWNRLEPTYRDTNELFETLTRLDPYRRRMTGPISITLNLSRRRSVTSIWRLQPPVEDGQNLSGTLSTPVSSRRRRSSTRRSSGARSSESQPTTSTSSTSNDKEGFDQSRRKSSISKVGAAGAAAAESPAPPPVAGAPSGRKSSIAGGLEALQALIPVRRKSSVQTSQQASSSSAPQPSSRRSSATARNKDASTRRKSSTSRRKSSVVHMPQDFSSSSRRPSSSASSTRADKPPEGPITPANYPQEVLREILNQSTVEASRDVIPVDEGHIAKEPLACLHKFLRDPSLSRICKTIREFGDRDYAILSSIVKAGVAVRSRAVAGKAKTLIFLAIAHEPSLMGAIIRLGAYLNPKEVACLACSSRQAYQLAKGIIRHHKAATVAQSSVRQQQGRQEYDRLKAKWKSAINIQRVVRGFLLGRKKLHRNRARLWRLQALGLEGDIIDVLEDKLLQPDTRYEASRVIVLLTKDRPAEECQGLIELGFFKAVSDQLKIPGNSNEFLMVAINCLTNLLPGFAAPSPHPCHTHIVQALGKLLCSTSFDGVESACRYVASLSPKKATSFPRIIMENGIGDYLVDLLMNPLDNELFFLDFPFALATRIKSWRHAAVALSAMFTADHSLVDTELAKEGTVPAVMSCLLSLVHIMKVCKDRLLTLKYNPALVKHVRHTCLDAFPVLVNLHKELFYSYTFTNSDLDAQLALLADQLLCPILSTSLSAHRHGLYILHLMSHDLKASMFLLTSGIVPTLETLLEIYLEGEMRLSLERLVLLLTKPIVTPAEEMVPFSAATPGEEQNELAEVVKNIQAFDANREGCAEQACHVLIKALEEQQ